MGLAMTRIKDRYEGGRLLARLLADDAGHKDVLVLAIPSESTLQPRIHFFNSACQLSRTVMGVTALGWPVGKIAKRKRLPSAVTSQP